MTRIGHVYERGDKWYIQPSSKTTTGLWIATLPLIQLDKGDSRQHKGEAAVEALIASQHGVPVPADDADLVGPLLAIAGVKSWAAFMNRARGIGLQLADNQLTIMPHRKLPRPKGALEGLPEKAIVLPAGATPEQIGVALEEAMSRCQ